jgi:hypothetical protein
VLRDGNTIARGLVTTNYSDLAVAPRTTYIYTVVSVDPAGNMSPPSPTLLVATLAEVLRPVNGYLLFESWANIPGTSVTNLIGAPELGIPPDPRYPNVSTFRSITPAFDTRPVYPDDSHDDYGGRLSGWLTPDTSGNYAFFLRSAHGSRLYLSPDARTNNLVLIAEETGCCQPFLELENATNGQTTFPITLNAQTNYAIQLVWKAGPGEDYAQVAWRAEGETTPALALGPIPGRFLSTRADTNSGPPALTVEGRTVLLGGEATLVAQVSAGTTPFSFQWRFNLVDIPGATNNSLTITNFGLTNIGVYTAVVNNAEGTATAHAGLFISGTKFVEAEDFNFGGGRWLTNTPIGMSGPYTGGSYLGLGSTNTDENIDWKANHNGGQTGRANTGVDVGKGNAHPDGLVRGSFNVTVNHIVGWNEPGEWYDYTRDFGLTNQTYAILSRLAGPQIHSQIDEVVAGFGTTNQALVKLGEFRPSAATAGLDSMGLFPLIDPDGQQVTVSWSGVHTFRYTSLTNGGEDIDYFLFVPIGGGSTNLPSATLQITARTTTTITLTYTGILEEASQPTGPWTPIIDATSPFTVPTTTGLKFYRARAQ